MIRNFLWMLPFIFFCAGYLVCARFISHLEITVPCLINLSLSEGFKRASESGLSSKILREEESSLVPVATIINQYPSPGSVIKASQHLLLVITKPPLYQKMPHLKGLLETSLHEYSKKNMLRDKYYYIESVYPTRSCLAHYPLEGEELVNKSMILYISAGMTSLRILPSFIGKNYEEVKVFLEEYGIFLQIIENKRKDIVSISPVNYTICDQKPLAGSLIDLKKPLVVYVRLKQ